MTPVESHASAVSLLESAEWRYIKAIIVFPVNQNVLNVWGHDYLLLLLCLLYLWFVLQFPVFVCGLTGKR